MGEVHPFVHSPGAAQVSGAGVECLPLRSVGVPLMCGCVQHSVSTEVIPVLSLNHLCWPERRGILLYKHEHRAV